MKTLATYIASFALLACSAANAEIMLVIDADNDQFWFTGSDSGELLEGGMGDYGVAWIDGYTSGSTSWASGLAGAFTIDGSAPNGASVGLYSDAPTGMVFSLRTFSVPIGAVTIVADESVVFDSTTIFNTWNATYESIFEGYIGGTIALYNGTGFSDVSVVAVPEPSAYAGLAGIGAVCVAAMRRRRK